MLVKTSAQKQFYNSFPVVEFALFCDHMVCTNGQVLGGLRHECHCDSLFSGQFTEHQTISNVLCRAMVYLSQYLFFFFFSDSGIRSGCLEII